MTMEAPVIADALCQGPPQAAQRLVLLHGWGADADDLLDLGALLVGPQVSVVALQAPHPHPSGTGRQWYDLQQIDGAELTAARRALQQRLIAMNTSVPLNQTCLLGFSQGAAMALDVACGSADPTGMALPLAGVIACSGYPHPDWQPVDMNLNVLLTHGLQDPVVPAQASSELKRLLTQAGAQVELIRFNGGHSIDPELLAPMQQFLQHCWDAVA